MGEIIAVGNQKGGVSKTTTVETLGAALALEGQRVLLVDFDPQRSLTLALTDGEGLSGDLVTVETRGGITYDLLTGDEMLAARDFKALDELAGVLNPLRATYDWIIIDTPPSLGKLSLNAMYPADRVIVPTIPHFLAVAGIAELYESVGTLRRDGSPIRDVTILITQWERNGAVREMERQIRDAYPTFETSIRRNVAIAHAQAAGVDVYSFDARSNAAQDYKKLARELLATRQQ